MNKYLKFSISCLAAMCLFAGAAFWDCAPLIPINIHMLPDSVVGLFMVLYAFAIAGVMILTILCYFNAVKRSRATRVIPARWAIPLLLGIPLYLALIVCVSKHYCRY
jgi:uncharacterized membrane protein